MCALHAHSKPLLAHILATFLSTGGGGETSSGVKCPFWLCQSAYTNIWPEFSIMELCSMSRWAATSSRYCFLKPQTVRPTLAAFGDVWEWAGGPAAVNHCLPCQKNMCVCVGWAATFSPVAWGLYTLWQLVGVLAMFTRLLPTCTRQSGCTRRP